MIYYEYSKKQLEQKSEELIRAFDSERLVKCKPIDVYLVIEKCIKVPYDWKYLTPDQSVLGLTAFEAGYIYVWPEPIYYDGLLPDKIEVSKGTILIEQTLTENDNRGRENFTVMHEIFHQILHKKVFRTLPKGTIPATEASAIDGKMRYKNYAIYMAESQANYCAAAFFMPKALITKAFNEIYSSFDDMHMNSETMDKIIRDLANDFCVSKQAMKIRLIDLDLIRGN